MDFEINYQVGILSNQINKQTRKYSTSKVQQVEKQNLKLNPLWISGFIDGEGCFLIVIYKRNMSKIGWQVELRFQISLHQKDKALLEQIQNYFGVGSINKDGPHTIKFYVLSIKDLQVIISHFDQFPLITQKRADYDLWKKAFNLIKNKEHLRIDGLYKIVAIRAALNRGLSSKLKSAFPDITSMDKPLIINKKILDPNWLAGFTSGEGCFYVGIRK